MYSILSKGGEGKPYNYTVFLCDAISDIATLPTSSHGRNRSINGGCSHGSVAIVINDGKYVLNSSNEWIKVEESVGLPAVTSEDNGKVLSVVNGQWDKAEGGSDGGNLIVTLTEIESQDGVPYRQYTSNVPVDEIIEEIKKGINPVFYIGESEDTLFTFESFYEDENPDYSEVEIYHIVPKRTGGAVVGCKIDRIQIGGNGSNDAYRYYDEVLTVPEFTETDNGKVLTVVNGSLAWATPE